MHEDNPPERVKIKYMCKIKCEIGYFNRLLLEYVMSLHFDINFFGCTYEVECIFVHLYVFGIKIHKMVA